jgi:hypothetical protein
MRLLLFILMSIFAAVQLHAQDSTEAFVYDPSQFEDASDTRKFCTQKVLNQTPTKLVGVGYEHNMKFRNKNPEGSTDIMRMGGLRTQINILAISTNKLLLMAGLTYWGTDIKTGDKQNQKSMRQVYSNRMDIEGLNLLLFKPLDQKHFIIAQANADASYITNDDLWRITRPSLTFYGSAIFGWKKGDYRMLGLGLSRTYRLGRPLIIPVLLFNQTFNDEWGIESLVPARAHLRYNVSNNTMLLAGYELEGQQYDLGNSSRFLQRGEIKPRLVLEQKLKGFFWLSAQLGYRINGRFDLTDRYDAQEEHVVFNNEWGAAPYFNLSINFVSP